MRSSLPLVMLFAGSALLQGCATNYPHQRAAAGATVGAITGAVIGHQLDHKSGRFYGAALGALAGGAVGNYMDNQQRDLQQSLADERRRNQIQIQRMDDNSLKLTLDSEVSFAFDSAEIKPSFQPSLDKLAGLLGKYAKTRVRVVGHTDSVGSDQYNQDLSERRAFAVSDYLANRGVDPRRLTAEGRGEREPRASNATDAGRQLNRRVEIFVTPIVEGEQGSQYQEQPGYQEPNQPPPGYRQQPSYQGPSQQQPGYQQGPYQQPGYQGPYDQQPGYQGPYDQQPSYQGPYDQQPSYQGPYDQQPGYQGSDQQPANPSAYPPPAPTYPGPSQGQPSYQGPYEQRPYQGPYQPPQY